MHRFDIDGKDAVSISESRSEEPVSWIVIPGKFIDFLACIWNLIAWNSEGNFRVAFLISMRTVMLEGMVDHGTMRTKSFLCTHAKEIGF
jgi:hypothetical protein